MDITFNTNLSPLSGDRFCLQGNIVYTEAAGLNGKIFVSGKGLPLEQEILRFKLNVESGVTFECRIGSEFEPIWINPAPLSFDFRGNYSRGFLQGIGGASGPIGMSKAIRSCEYP